MWKTRGKLIIYTWNMEKIYKRIWGFISGPGHIKGGGDPGIRTEYWSSTNLMY